MTTKTVPNDVLAERYASPEMIDIWGPEHKVFLERTLWIAVLEGQRDLGATIPDEAVNAYKRACDTIDLASIKEREKRTRHDVKARIEEFNALAGYELIHRGLTSRDLTDNVEQLLIEKALLLVHKRTIAILSRLGLRATEHAALDMCGRTHNVPAQTTTLGKRFANIAEELLFAFEELTHFITNYPLRGIKGPVGTQQDMADLFGLGGATLLEECTAHHLKFRRVLTSIGQVYPRSLDCAVVELLVRLAAAPTNLSTMVRLAAGHELMHEGFGKEQTGSSAMPHKMNSRTCERIAGLHKVLKGFLTMAASIAGDQWFEGDVSCSVVRRVIFPGAFFALDGIYEATLTVLDEMEVFPAVIGRELDHYLPFLSTTTLLTKAVERGLGREWAHALIKKHATTAITAMRNGEVSGNPFVEMLAGDEKFPLDADEIRRIARSPNHGLALEQVAGVCEKIKRIVDEVPEAAAYKPHPVL